MVLMEETTIEIEAGSIDDTLAEEIYRNLQVLYGTHMGEQALDREFGIDANITDYPQMSAQALLAAEIVSKTQQYEPRAQVVRVEWTASKRVEGNMVPKVVIKIV